MKVLEIRKAVQTALKAVHPQVWYERAPDAAQFPYLVFLLENAIDEPGLERFVLDVDGWDAPADGSTVMLEQLMEAVDQALHKRVVIADGVAFVIYRDRRFPVDDNDERIRRRKAIFELRSFEEQRGYQFNGT